MEVATGRRAAASRSTLVCNALHRYYRYYPYYTYYEYYTDVRATSREQRPSLNGFFFFFLRVPVLPCPSPSLSVSSLASLSRSLSPAFSYLRSGPLPFTYSPRSYLFYPQGLSSGRFNVRDFFFPLLLYLSFSVYFSVVPSWSSSLTSSSSPASPSFVLSWASLSRGPQPPLQLRSTFRCCQASRTLARTFISLRLTIFGLIHFARGQIQDFSLDLLPILLF